MVKTIELILGLPPMNQLDLSATPMRDCFQDKPDLTPYTCRAQQGAARRDEPAAEEAAAARRCTGRRSRWRLDLDEADEADEDTLNRILWHSVRG